MNQPLELLRLARLLPMPLAGGRGPRCWQCDLAQMIARLSSLSRVCGWIKTLAIVDLRLCEDPLFGSSLPVMTAGTIDSAETTGPPTNDGVRRISTGFFSISQGKPRMGDMLTKVEPSPNIAYPRNRDIDAGCTVFPKGETKPRKSALSVAQLPTHATQGLLERLCGKAILHNGVGASGATLSPFSSPWRALRNISSFGNQPQKASFQPEMSFGYVSYGSGSKLVPSYGDGSSIFGYMKAINRPPQDSRFRRSLPEQPQFKIMLGTSGNKLGAIVRYRNNLIGRVARRFRRGEGSGVETSEQPVALLIRQWSASTLGPTAPLEILIHAAERGTDTGNPAGVFHPTYPLSPRVKTNSPCVLAKDGRIFMEAASKDHVSGAVTTEDTALGRPVRFGMTPIPIVLPTQEPFADSVLHIPGMPVPKANLETRNDPGDIDEELEALAAKIKRILDDEARRHGIDV